MSARTVRARLLLLTAVVALSIWKGNCQTPVLFPSPRSNHVLVEDESTKRIYSVNGALPQFYFTNNTSGGAKGQCENHLLIHTKSRNVVLWFELLDDQGQNQALPPFGSNIDVRLIQINDTEANIPDDFEDDPEEFPEDTPVEQQTSETPNSGNGTTSGEEDVEMFEARGPQQITRLEAVVRMPSEAFMLNVEADVNGTIRCARVVLDRTKPQIVAIRQEPAKKGQLAGRFVKFVIDFSEKVVAVPANRDSCRNELNGVLASSESIFERANQRKQCRRHLSGNGNLKHAILLTNARTVKRSMEDEGMRVVVEATADSFSEDVVMEIKKGGFMDYAGNVIETSITESFTPRRKLSSLIRTNRLRQRVITLQQGEKKKKKENPRGKEQAEKMGRAVTGAIAAASAVSIVTSGGATQLLGSAQKTFYTGMLAVSSMPENYQGFTSQLNWAGLDIDIPGSESEDEDAIELSNEEGVARLDTFNTTEKAILVKKDQRNVLEGEDQPTELESGRRRGLLEMSLAGTGRKLRQLEVAQPPQEAVQDQGDLEEEEEEEEEEDDGIFAQVQAIQGILEADEDDGLDLVKRVLFWAALILAGILFLHVTSLGLCLWKRWPVPDLCQPPRIEILYAYWAMPAIAAAASSLFAQNKRWEALLGTYILIVFPIAFLSWNIYMLYIHFYVRKPADRLANMILEEEEAPPNLESVIKSMKITSSKVAKSFNTHSDSMNNSERTMSQNSRAGTSSNNSDDATSMTGIDPEVERREWENERKGQGPPREQQNYAARNEVQSYEGEGAESRGEDEEEEKLPWYKRTLEALDVLVFTTLFGKHQPPGDWVVTKPKSTFIAQYGPLFMDHRGCPVYRKGATFEVDSETGKVDRGVLSAGEEVPLLALGWFKVYRYQLQIVTTILDFTKGTLIACLVGGINEEDSMRQVMALLVISLVMMAIIRISLPFVRRAEMVVAMLGELADVITFSLSLYLILFVEEEDDEVRFRAGLTMLAAEGAAMLSLIIDRILLSMEIIEVVKEQVEEMRCPHNFFKTVMVHLQHYEPYLERKYFDRWMVKALHKGLHGRVVPRVELPPKVYIKQEFRRITKEMVGGVRSLGDGVVRRRKRMRDDDWH